LSEHTPRVRFAIQDTGIGIEPEQQGRLFSAFMQADNSTTRKYGGSGLGLAISKQLVEMMEGSIGVEGRVGSGSTFWFTAALDRVKGADMLMDGPDSDDVQPRTQARSRGHGQRILVAEDNATNRAVILAQLGKLGYKAEAVADGAQAVEAVRRGGYELVLMDCQMPVMDGIESTREIRNALGSHIPIVALTASVMASDRQRCLGEGMNGYLAKPVELAQLAETVAQWIKQPHETEATARPAAATFDAASFLDRLMGDRELAGTVIEGFLSDAPLQVESLRAFLEEGKQPGLHLQAHTLKGAAATVGAEALRTAAFALELTAAEGRLDLCPDLLVDVSDELERFQVEVQKSGWLSTLRTDVGSKETSGVQS